MASIASCMGPAAGRQAPPVQSADPPPSPNLLQDLMLVCVPIYTPPLSPAPKSDLLLSVFTSKDLVCQARPVFLLCMVLGPCM